MRKLMCLFFSTLVAFLAVTWILQGTTSASSHLEDSQRKITSLKSNHPRFRNNHKAFHSSVQNMETISWNIQTIDNDGDVGLFVSLALDSIDNPHLSYYDFDNGDLKYASWTLSNSWITQTVDSVGDVGRYVSLALDDVGNPHISYMDFSNLDLKYASWTSSTGWISETVDSAGSVGWFSSIALDSMGNPRIAYYDSANNYDLKYASWTPVTGWDIQIVDSNGDVGSYASLALDSEDNPHISYYSGLGNENLKYASWTSSTGWISETVDSAGFVGAFTSLALDSQDYPHIGYNDLGNAIVKYANWTPSEGWISQAVDSTGDVGWNISLILDSEDNPQMSYYDFGNSDLKYAKRLEPTGWISQAVDSEGIVGQYTSLALDSFGNPRIGYYHNDNGSLKYAATNFSNLAISKGGPPHGLPGSFITYTLQIANNNPFTLTSIVITDTIPDGADYVGGGIQVGDVVSWVTPILVPGETITRQFVVTATKTITNIDYRVSSSEGYSATGNVIVVTVIDMPITNLTAVNDSPTALGQITTLTASASTGSDIIYVWDLGDGTVANGMIVNHVYSAVGDYTTIVTAMNSVSQLTTTTMIVIDEIISGLKISSDSPTRLGETTLFSASIATGSNVTFLWDFGDGNTVAGTNPTHVYAETGIYLVTVTSENSVSSSSALLEVVVEPYYHIYLPIAIRP